MTLSVACNEKNRRVWLSTAGEDLKGLVIHGGSVDHYKAKKYELGQSISAQDIALC